MGRRHWRRTTTILSILLLVAGCSGRQDEPPATASSPPVASTVGDPKADVLAAYRAYWQDVIDAGRTADWQSPRLDDHAAGAALDTVRSNYRRLRADGQVVRGTVKLDPRVVALRTDSATVEDCTDVTRFLRHDVRTGKPVDPVVRDVARTTTTLTRVAGRWLVTNREARGQCRESPSS